MRLSYFVELIVHILFSPWQDSVSLHKKFIADCYKRLEVSAPPPL